MKHYICPQTKIQRIAPQLMQTASLPVIKDADSVTDSDEVYARQHSNMWDDEE